MAAPCAPAPCQAAPAAGARASSTATAPASVSAAATVSAGAAKSSSPLAASCAVGEGVKREGVSAMRGPSEPLRRRPPPAAAARWPRRAQWARPPAPGTGTPASCAAASLPSARASAPCAGVPAQCRAPARQSEPPVLNLHPRGPEAKVTPHSAMCRCTLQPSSATSCTLLHLPAFSGPSYTRS